MQSLQSLADSLTGSAGDAAASAGGPEEDASEEEEDVSCSPSRRQTHSQADVDCDADGVEALVAAMRGDTADEETQRRVLTSLDLLCLMYPQGERRARAVRVGVFDVLVAAMETHADCVLVQNDSCSLVALLCEHEPENQSHAERAGVVAAVLRALARHDDEDLAIDGAHVLSIMAHCCRVKVAAVQTGAIPALLTVMQAQRDSIGVQLMCCHVLTNLIVAGSVPSADQVAAGEAAAAAAVQAGAMDACVSALAAHRDNLMVHTQALLALRNMAMHTNKNTIIVRRASTLEAVVAAMQRHPREEDVARLSCGVLLFLTNGDINEATAGRCGGIEAVVAAMRTHAECKELQAHACSALELMTRMVAENVPIACNAGAIPALIATIRAYLSDGGVVDGACAALRNLTLQPCSKERFHHAGGFAAIAAVLRAHMQSTRVLLLAANVLANAVHDHANNCQRAADAGCVVLVLAALRKNGENAEVQAACLRALTGMLQLPQLNGTAVELGALGDVLAAMQRHAADEDVQQHCCVLVHGMMHDTAAARDAVLARGAVIRDALLILLTRHAESWDVLESAMVVLVLLMQRRPELRAAAVEAGGIEALLAVMCVC
jgi:hypothetical protein